MKVEIIRLFQDDKQTSGICVIYDNSGFPLFSALSLERGWNDNKKDISCVPAGVYSLKYEYSNRFKRKLWELKDVPNRSECKFHASNFWHQLNGCISLGVSYTDMNNDGYKDVTNSNLTINAFSKLLNSNEVIELTII